MRSRFTAFAIGDAEYLLATWHPRTRPFEVVVDGPSWNRLDILDVVAGGPFDSDGIVEFRAHHRRPAGSLHERSRFVREAGRWYYVDGDGERS
jgi:SEC-C motif-containing protein